MYLQGAANNEWDRIEKNLVYYTGAKFLLRTDTKTVTICKLVGIAPSCAWDWLGLIQLQLPNAVYNSVWSMSMSLRELKT